MNEPDGDQDILDGDSLDRDAGPDRHALVTGCLLMLAERRSD